MTVAVGSTAVAFGLFTLVARTKRPEMFGKLRKMKEQWGERKGQAIHVVGYTVIPILFGVVAIAAGLSGVSLF